MTRARQAQKTCIGLFVGVVGIVLASSSAIRAGEPVAVDPQSGLAISGFDPVAYFADAAAKEGKPDIELNLEGSTWRFRNEGNRAAFADRPDIYAPRFGGYDPVAIARGASVPGHPAFWLVSNERLYLFYSVKARAMFAADPSVLSKPPNANGHQFSVRFLKTRMSRRCVHRPKR